MEGRIKKSRLDPGITESRRLQILKSIDILDSPPEKQFDTIAHAAAYIANVPVALITFVDEDRQWFKAKVGFDASETPRHIAFCEHTIRQSRPMVIPDTKKDARFANNPLLSDPVRLRFYAGIPLISSEGAALGTLCVADQQPRVLTEEQLELLKGLASHVEQSIHVRRMTRKQQEQQTELERTNALLESIMENAPAMLFAKGVTELEHTIWNKAAEEITGVPREDILGKTGFESFPEHEMAAFRERDRRVLDEGIFVEAEETATGPRGTRILHTKKVPIFDREGRTTLLLGISEDITLRKEAERELHQARQHLEQRVQERTAELTRVNAKLRREMAEREQAQQALRESEARLRQSQKMDAIGRLAGGVAHDFNNLLMVILGYAQFVLDDVGESEELKDSVMQIISAGRSARDLTKQLLAFGRRQVLEPRIVSVECLVADLEKMLRRLIGSDIQLQTSFSPNISRVEIDPGQFNQVILNLAVNARDAMPDGGTLQIEARDFDQATDCHEFPDFAGTGVLLTVTDTGVGMDEATRHLVFEPFFTTKSVDEGTGLGLSIVLGIVEQSGGRVAIKSQLGEGTTFLIALPSAAASSTPDSNARRLMSLYAARDLRGSETVLVVDDDEQVRTLVVTILRRSGYDVLTARSPGDALLICEQQQKPIDLLLSDITMPRMNGIELSRRVKTMMPSTELLFLSGYAQLGVDEPVLQKPITEEELLSAVRAVFERKALLEKKSSTERRVPDRRTFSGVTGK